MNVFAFRASELVHPPEEVAEFVLRLVHRLTHYRGAERRSERRHRIALPLLVMPLDDQLEPAGEGFAAVTRDISSRGIALYHLQPVDAPFVAVELVDPDGNRLEAAVEVIRCRRMDEFYEIAGKFVTKVYQAPNSEVDA